MSLESYEVYHYLVYFIVISFEIPTLVGFVKVNLSMFSEVWANFVEG